MTTEPHSINRNGLFLKVLIGVLCAGLVAVSVGLVRIYGEVEVLKSDTQLVDRVRKIENLADSINADRHQRTIIIQGFRDDIADLKRRMEVTERGRK